MSALHERNYETEIVHHLVILLKAAVSFAAEQQKGRYHSGMRTKEKVDLLPRNSPLVEMAMLNAV